MSARFSFFSETPDRPHADGDAAVRALCDRGEVAAAARLVIERHGPALVRFTYALIRDPAGAEDAFQLACIDLWRGLDGFKWQSSLLTWALSITRRAAYRVLEDPHRRRTRPLMDEDVRTVAARVRTTTLPHLRTETKEEIRKLRNRLTPDEQSLLSLRVDQGLSWKEVTVALGAPDESPSDAELDRRTAQHRKQFERLCEKLRRWAAEADLLGG